MTSQGMAAWTIQRFGDREQRQRYLADLTSGQLAAVAFSEPEAGSDLSAMRTQVRPGGDSVVMDGEKMWVTGALVRRPARGPRPAGRRRGLRGGAG